MFLVEIIQSITIYLEQKMKYDPKNFELQKFDKVQTSAQ